MAAPDCLNASAFRISNFGSAPEAAVTKLGSITTFIRLLRTRKVGVHAVFFKHTFDRKASAAASRGSACKVLRYSSR